jgi:hypothetical protein
VTINVHDSVYIHSWNYGPCTSNSVAHNSHEGLEFTNTVRRRSTRPRRRRQTYLVVKPTDAAGSETPPAYRGR